MSRDVTCGRVLVVDDLVSHRNGLARLLRWDGWEVTTAADGPGALELAKTQRPDVVITDLEMPEMSGLELVRALHEHDAQLPVIVVTASCRAEVAAEAASVGADCCLAKPLDLARLARALAEALKRRSAMKRLAPEAATPPLGGATRHA